MDEKPRLAGRARKWFFARIGITSFILFVPFIICSFVAFRSLYGDIRETVTERLNEKALRVFVDASTSVVTFRDAVISGRPDREAAARGAEVSLNKARAFQGNQDLLMQSSWKKIMTIWRYARRGHRLEQANRVVELINQALTLAMNSTQLSNDGNRIIRTLSIIHISDLPVLRGQLHLVSTELVHTLQIRPLTFKERVDAAVLLSGLESNVARLSDTYGIVARNNPKIAAAQSNNVRHLHAAMDPLIATIEDVVGNDRYNDAHSSQAALIEQQFLHADAEIDGLSERTSDEAQQLLNARYHSDVYRAFIVQVSLVCIACLLIWFIVRLIEDMRLRASQMARQEAMEEELNADRSARKVAELALATKTDFLRTVMEKAPLGIATLDINGDVLTANTYLRFFLGEDHLVENRFNLVGSHRESLLDLLNRKKSLLNFERSFTMRNGSVRWADLTITRIYEDSSRVVVCMLRDITERKDVELRLQYEATHDGLTKLANRNLFRSKLGEMISNCNADGQIFATLFIDLDLFKYVNDTYGHAAGDVVLITVSSRLLALVGPEDIVARFGGDEFAVLLSAPSDLSKAESISQAIVASLAEPIPWEDQTVNIGSSIGLALGPADTVNAEEMMRNADTAMYAAKQMGRGRYVIFDPEMQEEAHQSAQLANDLQGALQDNTQIHLLYQPIVGLEHDDIMGFEALVRWKHPVLGEIPVEKFVKLAEQSGAIRSLGRYVMREACQQLTALTESIPMVAKLSLSVNISPSELAAPNFVESMVDVIRSTDFDPSRLYLEITESSMVVNAEQANRIMSRLREFGIRISIDDFGAGYSSLRYLQELSIDLLKVDRGFLSGNNWEKSGRDILRAIVNLAAGLQLPVVAEGVETPEQLQFVRALGCQYAQGTLWGKPVSIAEIAERLTGRKSKSSG